MNSKQKLIYEHKPIGIYNLENANSLIMAELDSYAQALQFIEDSADLLLKEMFFNSAEDKGAERFRSLYGCNYTGRDAKYYIAALMKHTEPFWNSELWRFERDKDSFRLIEYIGEMRLHLPYFSTYSLQKQKNIMALLRKYAPAHMAIDLIERAKTWDEIDALGLSFSDAESLGLTFDQLKM